MYLYTRSTHYKSLIASIFLASILCITSFPLQSSAEVPVSEEEIESAITRFKTITTDDQFKALSAEDQLLFMELMQDRRSSTQGSTSGEVVDCFDYYRFGSVQVDLSPTLMQTIPGSPLTFEGMLKNENPYPIVDGSVYVKIFKANEETFSAENGYPLVAFFEADKDITIPSNTEEPFSFTWKVPEMLAGGDYEAAFFFVTGHRFNLLGLSFTDDVTGNKSSFKITAKESTQVVFNKNSVTLNGVAYDFASFPPRFTTEDPVTLDATIINPSKTEKTVTLMWQLYNWDGLRPEFLLDTKATTVTLKPGEKRIVSYTATEYMGAVSYIVATLADGDANSILNSRFVRDDIAEIRLNFPSLYTYPLKVGEKATIFSCVHATNQPFMGESTLTLELTDLDTGKIFHTYTYEGEITSAMMGVRNIFTPTSVPQRIALTATLSHKGSLIDTITQTYDCTDLDPASCIEVPLPHSTNKEETIETVPPETLVIVFSLVLLLLVLEIYRRKRALVQDSDSILIISKE